MHSIYGVNKIEELNDAQEEYMDDAAHENTYTQAASTFEATLSLFPRANQLPPAPKYTKALLNIINKCTREIPEGRPNPRRIRRKAQKALKDIAALINERNAVRAGPNMPFGVLHLRDDPFVIGRQHDVTRRRQL